MGDNITRQIQRVAGGIQNVLNLFGPPTFNELEANLQGTINLLQFYALAQRSMVSNANAALAEATALDIGPFSVWTLIMGVELRIVKTATVTALRASIAASRGNTFQTLVAEELGPFGATETGIAKVVKWFDEPLICPPGTILRGLVDILGTDANCSATIQAEVGALG